MGQEEAPSWHVLWDIEQIKQLKARYFRLLDTKDWDAFADLFTEDCEHMLPIAPGADAPKRPQSNQEYLSGLRAALGNGMTVHHGHMPEITILGPREASGVWALFDYLDLERAEGPPLRMQGYGHYFETYRKCEDGAWRISSKRNVRIRIETLPAEDAE